jgi:O-antigen chain-terminating methyltransferase
LENRFRGSTEEIASRVVPYVEEFVKCFNFDDRSGGDLSSAGRSLGRLSLVTPVLDIGAGRGELVGALATAGIPSYGIDLDEGMVEEARGTQIDVRLGDGLSHLAALEDRVLGGVVATQVVEHLSVQQLRQLCGLASRKVQFGGRIIFETINPCSLVALSSNYFRDLTHVWPLHPDTLAYEMEMAGMKVLEIRYLSPVPESTLLKEVTLSVGMSPSIKYALSQINESFRQLNRLIYGYQDYCIIAEPYHLTKRNED